MTWRYFERGRKREEERRGAEEIIDNDKDNDKEKGRVDSTKSCEKIDLGQLVHASMNPVCPRKFRPNIPEVEFGLHNQQPLIDFSLKGGAHGCVSAAKSIGFERNKQPSMDIDGHEERTQD
ncbi:hypothetical protein K0M31_005489 [Melipona bicolor]|uniref:Uncharacterized protein n=1 Tax=Melipona bicolor TaxID=60889 RepID=A0AA40KMJ5_9HYME|nr:hypothetical protein K0M31_005489 [Melipona bicolor]